MSNKVFTENATVLPDDIITKIQSIKWATNTADPHDTRTWHTGPHWTPQTGESFPVMPESAAVLNEILSWVQSQPRAIYYEVNRTMRRYATGLEA